MSTEVEITRERNIVRVTFGGTLFTEYHYAEADRPYFYPVIGPTGRNVTRHWPMRDGENEEHDHEHHRSLWFVHGSANGHDFWTEGCGHRVVQKEIVEMSSGSGSGTLKTQSEWVAQDGAVVCTDERSHTFYPVADGTLMDMAVTLIASHGPLVLGDTKEGTMAIRVAPTLRVDGPVAGGHIVNSEGLRDGEAWGKRAAWCAIYGPIEGETICIALFDHPSNPRHPTWWHARTYGLFAANPFGVHDFEQKPKGTGDLAVPAGHRVAFRYRFCFLKGTERDARIAERYRDFIKPLTQPDAGA